MFLLGTYSVLLLIGVDNQTLPNGASTYGNNQWNIGTLILKLWLLNSVGSECFPYKEEVVGSSPTEATKDRR